MDGWHFSMSKLEVCNSDSLIVEIIWSFFGAQNIKAKMSSAKCLIQHSTEYNK